MKYVINVTFGGFEIPDEILNNPNFNEDTIDIRRDPILIEWVENHPNGDLRVVDIPNEATDFDLLEYDGAESIICVIDGKINYIYG